MGKKIDWNSYIGTKNRFDVKICDWEEQKEKHTRDDKVVCICPECGRYFVAYDIRHVVEENDRQIKCCPDCANKINHDNRKLNYCLIFGKPNKHGVIPDRWAEDKPEHNIKDKVIALCPVCKKYFISSSLKNIIEENNKQIKSCPDCSLIRRAKIASEINKGKPNESSRKTYFNVGDVLFDNIEILDVFYKKNRQHAKVKCIQCGTIFESASSAFTKKNPTTMCRQCGDKHAGQIRMDKNKIEPGTMCGFGEALYPGEPIIDSCGRHSTTVLRCTLNGCGNIYIARNEYLKNGDTKSCGCLHSWLEALTAKYLTLKGIHFTHGLWMKDILTKNGNPCQIDFQIEDEFNNHIAFIECQGEQHYGEHGEFGKLQREETDIKKKNYCKEHNLKLYEIRFDDDVEQRVNEILTELKLI